MPNYRRLRIAGGTYFFTVNLQGRRSNLLTPLVYKKDVGADLRTRGFCRYKHSRTFSRTRRMMVDCATLNPPYKAKRRVSASGAVMVTSTIVFERTMPGASSSGGINITSLPSTSDELSTTYRFFSKYGGWFGVPILLVGTIVWAYGSLLA